MNRLKPAGWLLSFSLAAFIGWFVLAMSALAGTGVTNSADLTAAQFDSISMGWIVIAVTYAVAVLLGNAGIWLLNRELRAPLATVAQVAAALSGIAIVTYSVIALSMLGFTGGKLGQHSSWDLSILVSKVAIWLALAAVVLTAIGLRSTGLLRRTGLVVAIIAGVFLAADLATNGSFPPFVVGLLWLSLGIGLLRRKVPSSA